MTEKQCGCQTQGLAILPVRYTVVPKYINRPTPNWVNLQSVTNVPLDTKYQFHVRTLRQGYLYVHLPNEIGNDKWQIYTIDHDGNLYKQHSNDTVETKQDLDEQGGFRCPNLQKDESHNKFITIPNPKEQTEIYIAFCESIWSDETLEKHEKDPEKRMQKIITANWQGNQQISSISAVSAIQQSIEQVLDFDPQFDQELLPYDDHDKIKTSYLIDVKNKAKPEHFYYSECLSYDRNGRNKNNNNDDNQPFGYDQQVLNKNTTHTPWTKQQSRAKSLANTMKTYSEGYSPVLIALEDPIGIAYELNGYYNEIYSKNQQYRQEREFEFDAIASYEYAMQILIQKEFERDFRSHYTKNPYFQWVMKNKKLPNSRDLPIFSKVNQLSILIADQIYGKPYSYYSSFEISVGPEFGTTIPNIGYGKKFYLIDKNYFLHGKLTKDYDREGRLALSTYPKYIDSAPEQKMFHTAYPQKNLDNYAAMILHRFNAEEQSNIEKKQNVIKDIKQKYLKCLNIEAFNQKYQSLQDQIKQIAENRAEQNINWLKQSSFYQHMKDFDGDIWVDVSNTNPKEKIIDNQFEIDQARADNEITEDESQKIAKQINPYGMYYSRIIDKCTSGLELTNLGKEYLQSRLKSVNANKDSSDSIVVRGLANNSQLILTDIQTLLEQIENTHEEVELSEVITTTKVGKIAAYYKKVQGFLNAVKNYNDELEKAQKVLKRYTKMLDITANTGIKMPGNEPLLKIFLSKPMLHINNFAVRLCNILFYPVNSNELLNKVNHSICYMLNMSFFGLYKKGQLAILQSQNDVRKAVVNSSWFQGVLLPKTQTLSGDVVTELTLKQRKKDLIQIKGYIQLQDQKNKIIAKVIDEEHRRSLDSISETLKKDIQNNKSTSSGKSEGFKDIRLAFVIAIFETINWLRIKEKTKGKQDDSFWSVEMVGSSISMMAATTELMYQFTKTAIGSKAIAAGRMKMLSGFFGAAGGVFASCQKLIDAEENLSKGNVGLALLNSLNGLLYFASAGLGFVASTTYHIPWLISRLTKRALAKELSRAVINRAIAIYSAQFMARRVVMLGLSFWIGLIALMIEGLIWYFTDDDLEEWLKYSALGTKNKSQNAFKDVTEQKAKFKETLKNMFGIDQSIQSQANNQNNTQQAKQTTDNSFTEYDALLLIIDDYNQQKQFLAKLLADDAAQKALAKQIQNQYEYIDVHGYSIGDIFSGGIN
jgi:hypothetical protein